MCYVLEDEDLIRIEGKTKEFKYEFLSAYIPLYNKIICGRWRRKRAIIDTHAGTGRVHYNGQTVLGSCGLFLEKTALKQELLEFYFIEKDADNYRALVKNIKDMCEKGFKFPAKFKKTTESFEKNGLPFEKKELMYDAKVKHPKWEQIHALKGDCVALINHVLKEIEDIPAFFFIDPCGVFKWKLIEKIVKKRILDENGNVKQDENGNKIQGTELFINFSTEAILRNKSKIKSRDNFFKEFFGMSYEEVQKEIAKIRKEKKRAGKRYFEYNLYVDLYKNKLKEYFDFVTEMSIVGIKSEKNPIYCLIFASNNQIAKQLYEHKEAELNKIKKQYLSLKNMVYNKRDFTYEKYKELLDGQHLMDEFIEKLKKC